MIKTAAALTLIWTLSGCASTPDAFGPMQALDQLERHAEGVWASDGYGFIIDVAGATTVYNATANICLAIEAENENPLDYFDLFRINASGTALRFSNQFEPYEIELQSLPSLPGQCLTEADTSPLAVFDAFTDFYATHYAFFDLHGLDWATTTREARLGLSEDGGEGPLVEAFIGLLSQLKDGHVSISATVDGDEGQFIAHPGATMMAIEETATGEGSPMAAFGQQYLRTDIETAILGSEGKNILNERIKYGITSDDIGYMAVMAEGGYAAGSDPTFEADATALSIGMTEVIDAFTAAGVKAVIIDLSVNHGGYDFLSRAIAGSFTDVRVPAYTKYAYDADSQSPYQLFVEPAPGSKYLGPVYVMTSDMTVSAGEILTLSLRALPNVTHVGAPTRGAFSDVLTKYLPNGWEVTLSNEIYSDHQGVVWEGRGIEPEIAIEVFDLKAPLDGHTKAIDELIAHIDIAD